MSSASEAFSGVILPARLPKDFIIGDYVVDGWLRDGGMAAIYRARNIADDSRVAIKLQLPSTIHLPEICERFDREAEAMYRVKGAPNVIEVFDAGVLEDGRRYFVMEWIDGEDLEERLDFLRNDDQLLSISEVRRLGGAIAVGLEALHECDLVHLDLKPANVMLGRGRDGAEVVKLIDFGIVADLRASAAGAGAPSGDEAVMGTSAYMAPEQTAGEPAHQAMDIFALGVVLYELTTGACVPPDGWTPETLPAIEVHRPGVPAELSEVVRACMRSDGALRPESAAEVARQLGRDVGGAELPANTDEQRSAHAVPARTGDTAVMPRVQVAALEQSPVRTGDTQVALTPEQALEISGRMQRPSSVEHFAMDEYLACRGPASNDGLAAVTPEPAGPVVEDASAEPTARAVEEPSERDGVAVDVPVEGSPSASTSGGHARVEEQRSSSAVDVPVERSPSASTSGVSTVAPDHPSLSPGAPVERVPFAKSGSHAAAVEEHPSLPLSNARSSYEHPHPVLVLPSYGEADLPRDESDARRGIWRWWWAGALFVIAVVVGGWLAYGSQAPDDATEGSSVVASARGNAGALDDSVVRSEEEEGEGAVASPESAPTVAEATVEDASQVASAAESASDPPAGKRGSGARRKGPDKATCKKMRDEAVAFKKRRDWSGVLDATSRRACWTGSSKKERRRLRVEAYAETANYSRCVKEGGKNSEPKIAARVRWCRKKLDEKGSG